MIKIGNLDISKLYLGTTEVDKLYLGTTETYSKGGPTPSIDATITTYASTVITDNILTGGTILVTSTDDFQSDDIICLKLKMKPYSTSGRAYMIGFQGMGGGLFIEGISTSGSNNTQIAYSQNQESSYITLEESLSTSDYKYLMFKFRGDNKSSYVCVTADNNNPNFKILRDRTFDKVAHQFYLYASNSARTICDLSGSYIQRGSGKVILSSLLP